MIVIVASGVVLAYRWRQPIEAAVLGPVSTTIVPGIHLLCDLGPSAAYIIETSDGLILIDSGLETDAAPLKREMGKLGLDWRKIRAILLTHAHGDHCGGAEHLRKVTGAKIYAGRDDAAVIKAGGPREAVFSTFYMPDHHGNPTNVDVELHDNKMITVGNVRIRALATPGHTTGSTCYLIERGNVRALFGGDVIMRLVGDDDPYPMAKRPLGTYSAYLPPRYRGDAQTYLASLQKLRALAVPDLVLPGHPLSDPTPQNPRMTAQRWEAMLDDGIKEMQVLLAHYETGGRSFLDGHPKRLLADLYYFGDFRGHAVYGFFANTKFYVVDAPGGPGYYEFLQAKLHELGLSPIDPSAVLLTSSNPKDTDGLKALVEKCHLEVVAPAAGLHEIQAICPPGTVILSADDLPKQNWFPVKPIALRGRGRAPTAYLLHWSDKEVLISGRIPTLFDHYSTEGLGADLGALRDNVMEYLISINDLEQAKPDLWLPAVSSDEQNANLYETEWKYIMENNYRLGRTLLEGSH
jgi:glyoxylase-like metal-dependent hydrolase (beta-lactamase superfamily II)